MRAHPKDAPPGLAAAASRARLSHKLASLHLASIAVLILVVVGSMLWVSVEHNRLAQASSGFRVDSAMAVLRGRMSDTVRDYSVWDDAYHALRRADLDWLYRNIGSSAAELGTVDLVVLLEPGSGRTYAWGSGSPPEGGASPVPNATLAALLARLDAAAVEGDDTAVAFTLIDGETWGLAAAYVHPVDGMPGDVSPANLPRQVHGTRIVDELAGDLGAGLMIGKLEITRTPDAHQAAEALAGPDGDPVAYLAWNPPRPGVRILRKVAAPLGLAILAVVVLSTSVARLIVRSADRLERALAAARAADDSKTEFLSTVSHELRTPMNGIMGVAQLLELTGLDPEQRELVDVLVASARTQMSLISDLLDLTRIESGNLVLAREPFAPATVLHELVELIRTAAQAKRVAVESDIGALEGLQVLGDERAFRQVVTNFLGNAVKFTEQGRVRLHAGVELGDGRAALALRVSDTGPGIAPDDLVRIFERFVRCDSTRVRHEGTGLGLAISRKLADLMGGTIGVESTLGAGSSFTFRVGLPLVAVPVREVEAA